MSIVYEEKKFNRVGRQTGTKKVVKDADGNETIVYVDESGNVIDNTYTAKQIKGESINISSAEAFLADVLEAADSLERARDFFVSGANQHLRLEAGGYTPEEKVAKVLLKNMPEQFKDLDFAAVVELVKNLKKTA